MTITKREYTSKTFIMFYQCFIYQSTRLCAHFNECIIMYRLHAFLIDGNHEVECTLFLPVKYDFVLLSLLLVGISLNNTHLNYLKSLSAKKIVQRMRSKLTDMWL